MVAAIGDVHGALGHIDRLTILCRERRVDALVMAGDLFGGPAGSESLEDAQRDHARRMTELLERLACPVYFIYGNDDFVAFSELPAHVHHLHGRRLEMGPWNVVGYEHSPRFMGGPLERSEEEIEQDLRTLQLSLDERSMFVTHCPAAGILDGGEATGDDPVRRQIEELGLVPGSRAVRAAVEGRNVRAHVHGHVHRCFGRDGRHFNVASGPRSFRAMLIDLECMAHEVVPQ